MELCESFLERAKNPSVEKYDFDGRHKMTVKKMETNVELRKKNKK